MKKMHYFCDLLSYNPNQQTNAIKKLKIHIRLPVIAFMKANNILAITRDKHNHPRLVSLLIFIFFFKRV